MASVAYGTFVEDYLEAMRNSTEKTSTDDVAQAVWQAVTEPETPMRLPAGADAEMIHREATVVTD